MINQLSAVYCLTQGVHSTQDESGGDLANLGNLPAQQAAMLIDVTLSGVTLGGMYALVAMGHGYLIENGRIVGAGRAAELASDPAVQRAYLGGAKVGP
jgi:hypothetical protein